MFSLHLSGLIEQYFTPQVSDIVTKLKPS